MRRTILRDRKREYREKEADGSVHTQKDGGARTRGQRRREALRSFLKSRYIAGTGDTVESDMAARASTRLLRLARDVFACHRASFLLPCAKRGTRLHEASNRARRANLREDDRRDEHL